MVDPPIVIRLLFGSDIAGAGFSACRIAGISLIALAVACWPKGIMLRPVFGILTYNLLVTLYLAYVAANGVAGILLWPATALHAGLSALLVRAWRKERPSVSP